MLQIINKIGLFTLLTLSFQITAADLSKYQGDLSWSNLTKEQHIDNLEDCQLKMNRTQWSHNLWPKENTKSKPSYDEIVDLPQILKMVNTNLQMENVLDDFFDYQITTDMLQTEMNRMAENTRDSKRLRELFASLDNNPTSIANCIAKPILVKKALFDQFNWSDVIHGELRHKAQAQIENSRNQIKNIQKIEFILQEETSKGSLEQTESNNEKQNIVKLNQQEFNARISKLNYIQELQEKESAFVFEELIKQTENSITVKIYSWQKISFNEWFNQEKLPFQSLLLSQNDIGFKLPTIKTNNKSFDSKGTLNLQDSWKQESPSTPEGRGYHSAVWTGTEMIIWGGYNQNSYDGNDYYQSGGRYNPATDTWSVTNLTNAPTGRNSHAAVWTGTEMIIWGGWDGTSRLNSGSRYNPVTNSWLAITMNNAPAPRSATTVVWSGADMIVWGGNDGTNYLNSGARYKPSNDTWFDVTTASAPSIRSDHSAVWTGTEMFIFGGYDGAVLSSGAKYNLSSNTWTAMTNAPIGRYQHTAIWTGAKMIAWGGIDNGEEISFSGGQYNPDTNLWSATTTLNAPEVRREHTAVWTGNKMIVWGGTNSFSTSRYNYLNTGGQYDPVNDIWINTAISNAPASDLKGYSSIWTGSEMIIWGAADFYLNTGSRYNPNNDSWVSTTRVAMSRYDHSAIWTGTEMVIWGGYRNNSYEGSDYLNSGGIYSPTVDSWTPTNIIGAPSNRYLHTAIWTGSEMLIWGGYGDYIDGSNYRKSGSRYNPLTDSWLAITNTGAPTARYKHSAIWTGEDMIVWGGWDGNNNLGSGGLYNIVSGNWSATSTVDASTSRRKHTAIWTGNEMIIYGGYDDLNYLNTGNRYSPVGNNWNPISNSPRARREHTAIWTGDEMIVWGGYDGGTIAFGGRYDPSIDNWSATSGVNAPNVRFDHTAVWTGIGMIVWGGKSSDTSNSYNVNSGARYEPDIDAWVPISAVNEPRARGIHTAVWTGNEMIIWGGYSSGYLNTTGTYYQIDGSGYLPEIGIEGNAASISSGDIVPSINDDTDFGTVYVVGQVLNKTFTIYNTGVAELNLSGNPIVAITGSSDFTVIAQPSSTIAVGVSSTFTVAFDPSTSENKTAMLSIINNDANESPYTFAITGSGINPEVDIQVAGVSVINGGTASFDSIYTNGEMVIKTFTIKNTGDTALSLHGNPKVSLPYNNDFFIVEQPTDSLIAPGGSTTFSLSFNPYYSGERTATITINNNDYDESSYVFQVFGIGLGDEVISHNGFELPAGNPMVSLSSNPMYIASGESSTITWEIANNASSCTKTGDWSGATSFTNGTHSETISNITFGKTYSIQCFNNLGDSPIKTTQVFVGLPPTLSELTVSNSTVESGGSSRVYWTVTNSATSCTKSGDWSGSAASSYGNHSELVTNITQDSTFIIQCRNNFGTSEIQSIQVVVGSVPTLTFTANPTSISLGETTTFSWTITGSPTSCLKQGGWSGYMDVNQITNGTHTLTLSDLAQSQTFFLRCENSLGTSDFLQVSIIVNNDGTASCPDFPPILGDNEDRTIIANATSVGGEYNGQYDEFQQITNPPPWPGNYGYSIRLSLTRNQYIAASFNSGTTNDHAKFLLATPSYFEGPIPTAVTISISRCPGNFTERVGGQTRCTAIGGAIPSLFWSSDPTANPALFCILEKDTQYYLNIVHSNTISNGYSTSGCGATYCGILARQTIVDL